MNRVFQFRYGWLIVMAMLYLAVQNALFLIGWVQPAVACVAIAGMVAAVCYACRTALLRNCSMEVRVRDVIILGITLLAALVLMEGVGIHGHTVQHSDYLVRNAVYATLIRESWPVLAEDGTYLVYYMSSWLPPAALAKCFPCLNADNLLFAWLYLGLALGILLFFTRLKSGVLIFLILFMLMGTPSDWFNPFFAVPSRLHPALGEECSQSSLFSLIGHYCGYHWHIFNPTWRQFSTTYNHAFPFFLFLGICFCRCRTMAATLVSSTLLLSASPLGGISALPLIALELWRSWNRDRIACAKQTLMITALTVCLLACIASYLLVGNGADSRFVWQSMGGEVRVLMDLVRTLIQYGWCFVQLVALFLIFRGPFKRKALFFVWLLSAVLMVIFWVGKASINELLYKGSLLIFLVPAFLAALAWPYLTGRRKACIILTSLLCSAVFLGDWAVNVRSYSLNADRIAANRKDDAGGTLLHPEREGDFYSRFWAAPPVDSLILKSGQTKTPR